MLTLADGDEIWATTIFVVVASESLLSVVTTDRQAGRFVVPTVVLQKIPFSCCCCWKDGKHWHAHRC